jgi:hypothetical protein
VIYLKKRRLSKSVKIKATYKLLKIPLQEAIVDANMPSHMYFYLDTRFTEAHIKKIKYMLASAIFSWVEYFDEVDLANGGLPVESVNPGSGTIYNCAKKYAKYNLSPVWFEEKIANGGAAVQVMMDAITTVFAANGFKQAARAYFTYEIPTASKYFTIKGTNNSPTAESLETVSLSVTINPAVLDEHNTLSGYGAMLCHAWMHRIGYRHPAGKYTDYFAGEVPMCMFRNDQAKLSTESDTKYTKYLT